MANKKTQEFEPRTQVALEILKAGIIAGGERTIHPSKWHDMVTDAIDLADELLLFSQGQHRRPERRLQADDHEGIGVSWR